MGAAPAILAGILALALAPFAGGAVDWLPLACRATETVGMHDYPGGAELYHASVFHENAFELRENVLFMEHLLGDEAPRVGLYLTLANEEGAETEFECRPVRGGGDEGFSCVNNPPSEMLLINPVRGRFTRGALGGWTFYGAREAQNGTSLFVEYGECAPGNANHDAGDGP